MVKYRLTYNDIEDNVFVCDISSEAYTGDVIDVGGYCILERPEIKEIYTVIRGTGMRINLEANQNLTLEDLYTENEKTFTVKLTRNDQVLFRGFIDPAGLSEDLVNDVWEVSIDCVDGLALLENLSYVDELGEKYRGKEKDIQVITNCLRRTGVTQDNGNQLIVRSSINTRYVFLPLTDDPLNNVYSNQERFIKDDDSTISSCKEVLESILRKYGASIVMDGDKWQIFSFYELLHTPNRWFYEYEDGVFQSSSQTNYNTLQIGSNINGFANHWVNTNQRKEIIPAVGAVKVNYNYGFVNSLLENSSLAHNDVLISQWTILNTVTLDPSGFGFSVTPNGNNDEIIVSNSSDVIANDVLILSIKTGYADPDPIGFKSILKVKIKVVAGATTYYLNNDFVWQTSDAFFEFLFEPSYLSINTNEIEIPLIPESGLIDVTIIRPVLVSNFDMNFYDISMFAFTDESIKGENHIQQILGNNTRVEDIIEITVGDNFSDIYLGALYKADTTTNTNIWQTVYTPNDVVGNQPILQILSEFIARHRKVPTYKLIGDVYGYFDYLQIYELSLIPNRVFMISDYSYNTRDNVVSTQFMELRRESDFNIAYSVELDYGNTEKPTIVG